MKKVIYIVGMIALIAAMIVITPAAAFEPGECDITVCASGCDYSSIQDAVDAASAGDTICVYNGTYHEGEIRILGAAKRNIKLKGEGADKVTLDGGGSSYIIGIGGDSMENGASGCVVEGFKMINSQKGIEIASFAPDCIVRNCVFEGLTNDLGIVLVASNTTFESNFILNSSGAYYSMEITPAADSCTIANNTFKDGIFTDTTWSGAIGLEANNCTIVNNTIVNNTGSGILLNAANNNTIARNNIYSNERGMWWQQWGGGDESEDNRIYLNNFNNTENVVLCEGGVPITNNIWNSTEPIEYVWNGTTYTNYLGNYWSDYTGTDADEDGIGDTAYDIPGSATDKDYHPLIATFENYLAPAVPPTPPKPFVIYGWVNYSNGTAVLNPNVTITNLNTSEVFVANTSPDSNYYQVVTTSYNISAGDVLHFNASDTNKTEFNHTVTQDEIDNGGFMQNITIVPAVPMPDLLVTAINAYHNNTGCDAWFNLSNEIDVTVENNGTGAANASNVSLYIDGVFFGKLPVPSLAAGANVTVTFRNWKPIGGDCLNPPCEFNWSYKDYNFTAIADCDGEVEESDETNNEMSVKDRACYNGYMADEPLENVAHGMLNGHIIFTTGDGVYTGLYSVGSTQTTHYNINLPAGATTKLALLNVYYTWCKPASGVDYACPEMEVSITTPGGTTYTLPLERAYNDTKCTCPYAMWNYPFGTYVYNVTEYISANGTYTVTVKNVCTNCSYFCVAAPGLFILYEDTNAPQIEYWLNEGADVLMGGRRSDGGYLAWWECMNNATFTASSQTEEVKSATLGVVAPWGGSSWSPGMTNYLFFNGIKLGTGVYHGYDNSYDETMNGITMHIGSTNAQVGVNVTDVTAYYMNGSDNVVGQADDGDNMMPAGAFLVVTYKVPAGICGDVTGDSIVNMGDVALLVNNVSYPGDPTYALANEWAGDVTGDNVLNMGDVALLVNNVSYPGNPTYNLNCR